MKEVEILQKQIVEAHLAGLDVTNHVDTEGSPVEHYNGRGHLVRATRTIICEWESKENVISTITSENYPFSYNWNLRTTKVKLQPADATRTYAIIVAKYKLLPAC